MCYALTAAKLHYPDLKPENFCLSWVWWISTANTAPARTPSARKPEAKVLVKLVVIITELSSVNCVW